jgi:RNA polymerase sigma factor (sigma-70 family)
MDPAAEARRRRFELLALPHLDAAYNLARWLAGNAADAEDVVQDAYLRAYRYFDGVREGGMRVWLLSVVRNAFLDWARVNRPARMTSFEASEPDPDAAPLWGSAEPDPETALLRAADGAALARLMEQLPAAQREMLVLREIEDLSYRDIASVTGLPVGTVMSRLARARGELRRLWLEHEKGGRANHGV